MRTILVALLAVFCVQEALAQCDYIPSRWYWRRQNEETYIHEQVCQGTTEEFTVDSGNLNPLLHLNYTFTAVGGTIVRTDGPRVFVRWTSLGTQQVRVTATNNCGTSTTGVMTVYVENSPPSGVAIASGGTSPCVGQTIRYRGGGTGNNKSEYKWRLVALDGGSIPYLAPYGAVVWDRPGQFRLYCTSINGCGDGPTTSKLITVYASPTQPGAISGSGTLCQGTTATYTIPAKAGERRMDWLLWSDRT